MSRWVHGIVLAGMVAGGTARVEALGSKGVPAGEVFPGLGKPLEVVWMVNGPETHTMPSVLVSAPVMIDGPLVVRAGYDRDRLYLRVEGTGVKLSELRLAFRGAGEDTRQCYVSASGEAQLTRWVTGANRSQLLPTTQTKMWNRSTASRVETGFSLLLTELEWKVNGVAFIYVQASRAHAATWHRVAWRAPSVEKRPPAKNQPVLAFQGGLWMAGGQSFTGIVEEKAPGGNAWSEKEFRHGKEVRHSLYSQGGGLFQEGLTQEDGHQVWTGWAPNGFKYFRGDTKFDPQDDMPVIEDDKTGLYMKGGQPFTGSIPTTYYANGIIRAEDIFVAGKSQGGVKYDPSAEPYMDWGRPHRTSPGSSYRYRHGRQWIEQDHDGVLREADSGALFTGTLVSGYGHHGTKSQDREIRDGQMIREINWGGIGRKIRETTYKDGKAVRVESWDASGNPIQ